MKLVEAGTGKFHIAVTEVELVEWFKTVLVRDMQELERDVERLQTASGLTPFQEEDLEFFRETLRGMKKVHEYYYGSV